LLDLRNKGSGFGDYGLGFSVLFVEVKTNEYNSGLGVRDSGFTSYALGCGTFPLSSSEVSGFKGTLRIRG
jgi:hypothetical protein